MTMTLMEFHELFWSIATGETDRAKYVDGAFVGTTALEAASRMEIYANMFVWRQVDALREDFPKLAVLMGDEAFDALVADYIRAHPSEHYSLSTLGQHLATFLAAHPGGRPDLADMAALEWARAAVFDEAAVPVAGPECCRMMAATDAAQRPLLVIPALRLLRLRHDVLDAWRVLEDGMTGAPAVQPGVTCAAVWRKDFDVFHVRLEAEEACAFEHALRGEPLGVVCQAFGDCSDAVDAAVRAVGSWFAEGWIRQPLDQKTPCA